jgi:hypothetical protein
MSTAASLSLLKGGAKKTVEEELEKAPEAEQEAQTEGDDEEITVDVDKMDAKAIDALVAEHEIEVPDNWKKLKVAEKRAWLKEQFEETDEGAEGGEAADADPEPETPAADPEPAPEQEAPAEEAKVPAKAEPKKAPAKKAGKAVAKKTTEGTIEQPGEDVLSDLVHEIENLKEDEARHMVASLNNETEMTMFKLGGVLSVIQANGWYQPYASFREFVEKDLGIHYRKATYWSAIYNHLSESKVPWEKVKGIGWTKLKEIAEVLTVDNVDDWVKIASEQTTLQLIETVKNFKQKDAPKALEDQSSKTVTTMTFKVHEDQKEIVKTALQKAKDESGTTVDTAALEFICMDYIGGQSMADKLKKMGLEAALEAVEKAFPNTNISVELEE